MKPLMHKLFFTLLLLSVISLNIHADSCSKNMYADHSSGITMKDVGELTTGIVEAAYPNVLLCMPSGTGVETGDVIGKVVPGTEPDSFVCEYPRLIDATVMDTQVAVKFDWLDATYEQLATWLTSFAHVEKNDNGYHYASRSYYVSKNINHDAGHLDICVQSTVGKGFEFGYETASDDGQKSCGLFVGALYFSPFFRATPDDQAEGVSVSNTDVASYSDSDDDDFCSKCESLSFHGDCPRCTCSIEEFYTECDLCNGNGCGVFRCSLFTGWKDCPKNSYLCDHILCYGFSCPKKPVCCKKVCHKKPTE